MNQEELKRIFLSESYPNQEKDMEDYFVSYYFWEKWNGNIDSISDVEGQSRAIVEAKYRSLQQTTTVESFSKKGILLQCYKMQKEKWHHQLNNVEDVVELMEKHLENITSDGTRSEVRRIIDTLIPAMEQLGMPVEDILTIPSKLKKASQALPMMKKLYSNYPEKEAQEKTIDMFQDLVSDSTIPVFRRNNSKRLDHKEIEYEVNSGIYLLPNSEMIVIETKDRTVSKAIEVKLDGLVPTFSIRDAAYLIKHLNNQYFPRDNELVRVSLSGKNIVESFDGIYLPSDSMMRRSTSQELAKYSLLLETTDADLIIPIFQINETDTKMTKEWERAINDKYIMTLPFDTLDAFNYSGSFGVHKYYNGDMYIVLLLARL